MGEKQQPCLFVFVNGFKAKFPCQRPRGHQGAHSLSRFKGDKSAAGSKTKVVSEDEQKNLGR